MNETYTIEEIMKGIASSPKRKIMSPERPERDGYYPTEMTMIEVDMFLYRLKEIKNKRIMKDT